MAVPAIETRKLVNLKPYASSRYELDIKELSAEFAEEIGTERIANQFVADFTAHCDKEGLV